MSKPVKQARTINRYSERQKRFARFLFISGEKLETISKRLGIPFGTLATFSSSGKWVDDKYPLMSPDDVYQACLTLSMDELLTAVETSDQIEKSECISRAHKLTIMMRSIADIAPLRKATMQGFMRDVIKKYSKHPNLDEILRISQEYHDALYQEEETEKI